MKRKREGEGSEDNTKPTKLRKVDNEELYNATTFLTVVSKSEPEELRKILEKYPDLLNSTDDEKNNALHIAVQGGNREIVELLIDKKPDLLNDTNYDGENALHIAVKSGNKGMVEYLTEKDPDLLNGTNNYGENALLIVARTEYIEIVELLINKSSNLLNSTDDEKNNTLHIAVKDGNRRMVEYLIEKYPDLVNGTNNDGENTLSIAVKDGNRRMVEYLTEKYPDLLNGTNNYGRNAFIVAVSNQYIKIETLEYLLAKHPAFLTSVDKYGINAFHMAAAEGTLETLEYLLAKHSAFLTSVDNYGSNAFHIAVYFGIEQTVELLLEKDPSFLTSTDKLGFRALYWAVERKQVGVLKILLEHGADPEAINSNSAEIQGILNFAENIQNLASLKYARKETMRKLCTEEETIFALKIFKSYLLKEGLPTKDFTSYIEVLSGLYNSSVPHNLLSKIIAEVQSLQEAFKEFIEIIEGHLFAHLYNTTDVPISKLQQYDNKSMVTTEESLRNLAKTKEFFSREENKTYLITGTMFLEAINTNSQAGIEVLAHFMLTNESFKKEILLLKKYVLPLHIHKAFTQFLLQFEKHESDPKIKASIELVERVTALETERDSQAKKINSLEKLIHDLEHKFENASHTSSNADYSHSSEAGDETLLAGENSYQIFGES